MEGKYTPDSKNYLPINNGSIYNRNIDQKFKKNIEPMLIFLKNSVDFEKKDID